MPGKRLAFGPFLLNAENGTLLRNGEPVAVGGRGLRLLEALLRRPGAVVTKADMMDAAWPGLAVEESNLSVQVALLRKALALSPSGGDWIATIPRVGYRFIGPVDEAAQEKAAPPEIPSLAVLPFANLSNDPEQDFFAEGLAEEIVTTLSKLSRLLVIARSVSFAFRGGADLRRIAKELHVRYVLEGSVRKAGSRIRMTASLVEAETGGQVWADRYDREVADVFAIQDEVTRQIVDALRVALRPTETVALAQARTRDIGALDCFLRARAIQRGPTHSPEISRKTIELFNRAIDRDPGYAQAYAALAIAHIVDYLNGWTGDPDRSLSTARRVADLGIQNDPNDPYTHLASGLVAMFNRDLTRAASEADAALKLNPDDGLAVNLRGNIAVYFGDALAAIPDIERAMRLDPGYGHQHLHFLGMAYLVAGQYETAAGLFRERILLVPQTDMTRAYLAAALGQLGQAEEARQVLDELHEINPGYAPLERLARLPFKHQEDIDRIAEGLRKAGLLVATNRQQG